MKPIYHGKVREIYDISDQHLAIVTTDRVSAFDHVLPVLIPNKGVVLNRLSNFWFEKTKHIIPNHIADAQLPAFFQQESFRNRTVIVEKLNMFPFEFVVRGYLFGTMWNAYQNGEAFCGHTLTGDYQLAQKLEYPILTTAIKRDTGHDEYVDIAYVASKLGAALTKQIAEVCLKLYEVCSSYALSKGFIIADTKFEFGLNKQSELVLADEIFTPDSSRFWDAADYQVGVSPKSYDKQLLRDWLSSHKVGDTFPFTQIPKHILTQTEQRYQECLNRLVR